MRYAVIKKYKNDPKSFGAVIEYFSTIQECEEFIKKQKTNNEYEWFVGEYQ